MRPSIHPDHYVPRVYHVPDNRYPVYGRHPIYPIALRVMTLRECASPAHLINGHGTNYRWVNEWRADLAVDTRASRRTPYILICVDTRESKATSQVIIEHVRYHSEDQVHAAAFNLSIKHQTEVDVFGYVNGQQKRLCTVDASVGAIGNEANY